MENLPVLSNMQIPAYLAKLSQNKTVAESLLTGATGGVPRISLKQSRFRIREGQDEFVLDQLYLDTIIVDSVPAVSKMYYAKPWNPGDEPSAPDCHSILGDKPSPDSATPQNDVCATCPKNEWGSKLTPAGKQIKACSDSRRIAVVAADSPEKMYLLVTPAASMQNLTKYAKTLLNYGVTPQMVRTRISFDTTVDHPLLKFDFAGLIDEAASAIIENKVGSTEVKDILGLLNVAVAKPTKPKLVTVKPDTPSNPVAAQQPQVEAPKPTPAAPRGFGKATAAPAPAPIPAQKAPPKPAPAPAPAAAPAPAPAAAPANASSLADLESQLDDLLGAKADV